MASSQPVKNNNFLKYQSFGNAIMIYLSKAIAMSWLLMWTLSPHLGACTILHWSLLHLPSSEGEMLARKGCPLLLFLSRRLKYKRASSLQSWWRRAACFHHTPLVSLLHLPSELRKRLTQVSKQVVKEERAELLAFTILLWSLWEWKTGRVTNRRLKQENKGWERWRCFNQR